MQVRRFYFSITSEARQVIHALWESENGHRGEERARVQARAPVARTAPGHRHLHRKKGRGYHVKLIPQQ